ncbi:MAG: hypothetical protein AMJ63_05720 [Myxococcales bacterium SG8_38_1]|nr:MAG: hypothetical protein AMJ63_05720 [Myxococcales bacterium SG8_38_1]
MSSLINRHRTGYAHGDALRPKAAEVLRLSILGEHVGACSARRRLTTVEHDGSAGCPVVHQHECAATDAGALRLHQAEYHMRGYRRIHCMAASLQHADRRVDRRRVGGADHRAVRPAGRRAAGRSLGIGDIGARGARGEPQACGQQRMQASVAESFRF